MGKKTKIVGITLGVIFVALIASLLTLWMMFPPEKLKALIIPQVEKVLGRKVTLEKASLNFFPVMGVNLTGLEISNTERDGFSDEPFVKVDNLMVRIPLLSLLKKQPEISKILIKKPQVILEIDSSGQFNYDDLALISKDKKNDEDTLKKNTGKGMIALPLPITLKELTILDGVFTYRDKRSAQEFIVGDMDQTVRFSIDKELKDINTSGDLVFSQVSVKTKEITKPLSNLRISLSHDVNADLVSGKADLKKVRLSFQKVFLNLNGTVCNFNTVPYLDLKIDSDPIEIRDILAEIPRELAPDLARLAASGTAELDLSIKGALEKNAKFPLQGSLTIKDGMVKYSDLPKSINKINTSLSFTDNSLDIRNLSLLFGSNPIELKGTVKNFAGPVIDLLVKADVDLGDLKQMARLPDGASVSGKIKTDISAKGVVDPTDPSKLDVKGRADLNDVSVQWPPLVKPAVINGLFTLSSKAIGHNLSLKMGNSSMKMDASINNYLSLVIVDSTKKAPRPSVDFKITSTLLNFDEFLPPAKQTADTENKATAKTDDNSSGGPLIAPLPGIDMKGTVAASKIIYKNVEMNNMQMKVSAINDIADLDVKTGFSRGTITEKIHADLRNTKSATIKNSLAVSDVEINDLLVRFGNFLKPTNALNRELRNVQNNLYGKINLKSDLTTTGGTQQELSKSLKGTIDAKLADGKISNSLILNRISGILSKFIDFKDISFRNLKTTLRIEDETVYFDDFSLQSDLAGDWELRGNVGFDAKLDMDIDHRMTKAASQKVLAVQNTSKSKLQGLLQGTKLSSASGLLDNVGIPSDEEGRITLKIDLSGTASDPKPSFSGFGKGSSSSSAVSKPQTPKEQVTQQVKNTIEQNKATVEKKLNEEKQKLEEELKKKVPVTPDQGQILKNKAADKLKKLF